MLTQLLEIGRITYNVLSVRSCRQSPGNLLWPLLEFNDTPKDSLEITTSALWSSLTIYVLVFALNEKISIVITIDGLYIETIPHYSSLSKALTYTASSKHVPSRETPGNFRSKICQKNVPLLVISEVKQIFYVLTKLKQPLQSINPILPKKPDKTSDRCHPQLNRLDGQTIDGKAFSPRSDEFRQ